MFFRHDESPVSPARPRIHLLPSPAYTPRTTGAFANCIPRRWIVHLYAESVDDKAAFQRFCVRRAVRTKKLQVAICSNVVAGENGRSWRVRRRRGLAQWRVRTMSTVRGRLLRARAAAGMRVLTAMIDYLFKIVLIGEASVGFV